ncbi:hypothetical protein [Mesorhizobium xinjiangense]|uniref:hypothetical protein n=1 Tax=Mesorhizobium xinjiangense TaxID=2678685 RepID=UPI0012ED6372|nr:hypothetical protein [Mesorhizobium xinjiangense]
MTDTFSRGSRNPEILRAAEHLADLQLTLVSIRRAKASLINSSMSSEGSELSLESLEGNAIANSLEKLATLDTYERRTLSRRRKSGFALLLALEQASKRNESLV